MYTHAFIRGLFGEINKERHPKIILDFKRALVADKNLDYICYVMGTENKKFLEEHNIKCQLVNPNPIYHKYLWRHKLDIYDAALSDFDEICYLDWDCNNVIDIPANFWDLLHLKQPIQGCLYKWSSKLVADLHNDITNKYLINNGFLYISNQTIAKEIINTFNMFPNNCHWRRNDEFATTYYIDSITKGWKGTKYWLDNYEPDCCRYTKGTFKKVNPVFVHHKTFLHEGKYIVH